MALALLFGENAHAVAYSAQPLCWSGSFLIYISDMHTGYGTPSEHLANGLDTMGSALTVTPVHSIPVIYIEILLFRN